MTVIHYWTNSLQDRFMHHCWICIHMCIVFCRVIDNCRTLTDWHICFVTPKCSWKNEWMTDRQIHTKWNSSIDLIIFQGKCLKIEGQTDRQTHWENSNVDLIIFRKKVLRFKHWTRFLMQVLFVVKTMEPKFWLFSWKKSFSKIWKNIEIL